MEGAGRAEFLRLFHVWDLVGLGVVGMGILVGLGQWSAAIGVAVGVAMFILKSYFLYETGRALVKRRDRNRVGFIAGTAGLGRLAFVGVTLAAIAQASGVVVLAAGAGLVACQIYFHFVHTLRRGESQCPEG